MRHRLAIALVSLLAMVGAVLTEVDAAPVPSLKLVRNTGRVTFTRASPRVPVALNFGLRLASVDGAFELRATRAGYADPIEVTQVDALDPDVVLRDLPSDVLSDWFVLDNFLTISVRDRDGELVKKRKYDVCPNRGKQRLDDSGPALAVYPSTCTANPFTIGAVMGISEGWAIDPGVGSEIHLRDGRYRVKAAIAPTYRKLFGISEAQGKTRLNLVVQTRKGSTTKAPASKPAAAPLAPPVVIAPDPATLPDLQALPAWGINVRSTPTSQELGFNATEWNAGPAPLVIEGALVSPGLMQAAQFFYDASGVAVGQDDDVGQLEFHPAQGHDHWHFQQFVTYDLVSGHNPVGSPGPLVTSSGKMAWCLVPTDAIDLTVEGATWRPGNTSLHSACGNVASTSIREVLHVGHGDTYNQTVSGQTFDITNVPAGAYQVRIEVNPAGEFHEVNTTNNVSVRNITIGGLPGQPRSVQVGPVGNVTA